LYGDRFAFNISRLLFIALEKFVIFRSWQKNRRTSSLHKTLPPFRESRLNS